MHTHVPLNALMIIRIVDPRQSFLESSLHSLGKVGLRSVNASHVRPAMPNIINVKIALCDAPKANIVHPIAGEPFTLEYRTRQLGRDKMISAVKEVVIQSISSLVNLCAHLFHPAASLHLAVYSLPSFLLTIIIVSKLCTTKRQRKQKKWNTPLR